MSTRTRTAVGPSRPPGSRARSRVPEANAIPTVKDAKRRLTEAAARPEPWLTPEGMAALEQIEEITGGVFGAKTGRERESG